MKTLEGNGVPIITYQDSSIFKLPAPTGPDRKNLRLYYFKESTLSSYISEGNALIDIGKRFQFNANLNWACVEKIVLKALWKAAAEPWVYFTLNEDKAAIKFAVKVQPPSYQYTEGIAGIGYAVGVQMIGTELLDEPGYGDILLTGFGLEWGVDQENQSP